MTVGNNDPETTVLIRALKKAKNPVVLDEKVVGVFITNMEKRLIIIGHT